MKAVRVRDGIPTFGDEPNPDGPGVRVHVEAASICSSDLALLDMGMVENLILGHEIAGFTDDGSAVAIEPIASCATCVACAEGSQAHCLNGPGLIGVARDGGMAEQIVVPTHTIVPLPSGVDPSTASLVEPLAVALHAIARGRISESDTVLVVGAGAIGLACVAVLTSMGIACDVAARHPHQQQAAERLGGSTDTGDGYDVVIDSVGTAEAFAQAVSHGRPGVRIVEVGMFWNPVPVDVMACLKEVEIIGAAMYGGLAPDREIDRAARILGDRPAIADVMITHRFPLDGATEAFATASDRTTGAIKVVFEPRG